MNESPSAFKFDVILAAGGVLIRPGKGEVEVLLALRKRDGDWPLPKGKLEESETFQACAIREVGEETGLSCRLGKFVGSLGHAVDNIHGKDTDIGHRLAGGL
jgi:8-oxo-dGTP diphosphatase